MATLTVQDINASGITPSYTAASAGGDEFANDGKTMLHVKNGGVSSITVTIISQKTCNQGYQHNLTVDVAADGEKMIGPFSAERFNNENGRVQVQYSDVTSVTVAALQL